MDVPPIPCHLDRGIEVYLKMETELRNRNTQPSLQTRTIVRTNPVAFGLSVAGLAIQTAVAVLLVSAVALANWAYTVLPSSVTADWTLNINLGSFLVYAVYTVIVLAIGFFGAWWLRSGDSTKIKTGAVLVLVASLISITTVWGLFFGSLLSIVGASVALATIRKEALPYGR